MRQVKKKPISIVLGTIALAFFINIKSVNSILGAMLGFEEESGFMSILYASTVLFLFTISFLNIGKVKFNKQVFIFALLLFVWYMCTKSFIQEPRVSIVFFGVFTISAFIIPSIIKIDARLLLLAIMLIPTVGILYVSKIFSTENSTNETITMTVSYAFMVPVVATILYLVFYYKHDGVYTKSIALFSSLINLFFLYEILSFGSRGPFVCILVLILFLFLFKKKKGTGISVRKTWLAIMTPLVLFFSVFFMDIIISINMLLGRAGLSLNVVDKFVRMGGEGDWTNGREYISKITMAGIIDSPIIGHGVDQFENNTGIVYPHNFILQILYDGGLMFFIILLIPLLIKLIKKGKNCDIDEYILIILFFVISVPGALVSSDLWNNERLWIFFGFIFSTSFVLNKRKSY